MPDFQDKLEFIKRNLKSFDFYSTTNSLLNLDGLAPEDIMEKRQALFLGIYSEEDILNALSRYGIKEKLEEKGFHNLKILLKIEDPFHQEVLIFDTEEKPDNLLSHFIAREGIIKPKQELDLPDEFKNCEYEVIIIEWLCMQNPREKFSKLRPKLPGQRYPGLGVGREVLNLLIGLAKNLEKDGLMDFPEFFHNARLYSAEFRFYNPEKEGIFQAMLRDLEKDKHSLSDISYAIFFDCLLQLENNSIFKWFKEEQILPTSEKARNYFKSNWYQSKKKKAKASHHFKIDWEKFEKIKSSKNIYDVI